MKNKESYTTVDKDLIDEWKQYQVTKFVWKKLNDDFNPYLALWTCSKDELARHQGQIEILEALRTYFEA